MVKADSVILELSNPELELQALDAESQARQAEASYTELKVRLQSQALDQKAAAARVQADYEQAKMQADTNTELARQGLIADLTRKLSDVAARELGNRNGIEQQRLAIASQAPAAQNGTVTVDVALEGPLPQGARPDLTVDGTIELERLTDIVYVGRPAQAQPNGTVGLFKLDADGVGATRVKVGLGRSSVSTIEVTSGLVPGDQVVLSDTSAWDAYDRIRLK